QYGFFGDFLSNVVADPKVQARVAQILGDAAKGMTPDQLGQRFLEPGLLFKAPIDQISLGMAIVFGAAGLPHILMRFFTVPTARQARQSVLWAMGIIGGFYLLTLFMGFGAARLVGPAAIAAIDPGGNMAAPLLAQYLGGGVDSFMGNFMLAFVSAVAFATIVAVVAGLVLAAASAIAHDLYVGVYHGGEAVSQERQVRAARIATIVVGALAIGIGIAAKGQNVAHLVALAFAVAASANFPCILLTMHWRRCNTGGIVLGMVVGTVAAVGLTLVSPNVTYPQSVREASNKVLAAEGARRAAIAAKLASGEPALAPQARIEQAALDKAVARARDDLARVDGQQRSFMGLEAPLFELKNPGIVSIPLGFLAVLLGSLLFRDRRAEERWHEVYARQHTGIRASRPGSY
ncbi:MAG: solute symporter family protein, partial [Steroidobacteraceae bacterium]